MSGEVIQMKPLPSAKEVLVEYKKLTNSYNELVEAHNARNEDCKAFLTFMTLQCGILSTAITGGIVEDPTAPMSALLANNNNEDLMYMRKNFCTFVNAITSGKSVSEALGIWQESIK